MPEVVVHVKVRPDTVALLRQLSEQAVQRAIFRVKHQLEILNHQYVPFKTGALRNSFDVFIGPTMILMKWSAMDARAGYNYAQVADEGRAGGTLIVAQNWPTLVFQYPPDSGHWVRKKMVIQGPMAGAYYSEAMAFEAVELMAEEIAFEYSLMSGVGG